MQFVGIRELCCTDGVESNKMLVERIPEASSTTCLTKEGVAVALRSIGLG